MNKDGEDDVDSRYYDGFQILFVSQRYSSEFKKSLLIRCDIPENYQGDAKDANFTLRIYEEPEFDMETLYQPPITDDDLIAHFTICGNFAGRHDFDEYTGILRRSFLLFDPDDKSDFKDADDPLFDCFLTNTDFACNLRCAKPKESRRFPLTFFRLVQKICDGGDDVDIAGDQECPHSRRKKKKGKHRK